MPSFKVKTKNTPLNYLEFIAPLPDSVQFSSRIKNDVDLWLLFTLSKKELTDVLKKSRQEIKQNGMIWVFWPKKSSGVKSDITEDTIRRNKLTPPLVVKKHH